MKSIPGTSLLLLGSGLYWILSSRLISSFSVLTPGLFQSSPFYQNLITTAGVISATVGLWTIENDLTLFSRLATKSNGYLYAIPIMLVSLDIYSTVISLSSNSQVTELNPFVASAIQYGSVALIPFLVSYLALSQGVALLMISTGTRLFGAHSANRFLPFTMICGVSSFGPFSNIMGILIGLGTSLSYVLGAAGSIVLAGLVLRSLMRIVALTSPHTSESIVW
jgi:hypothetical protein